MIKAKNGKRFSNIFYRFGKPVLIFLSIAVFATVFILHSTTYTQYKTYKMNFIYLFNLSTPVETVNSTIKHIEKSYPKYDWAYFTYNDLDDYGKRVRDFYHVDVIVKNYPEIRGIAIITTSSGFFAACRTLEIRYITITMQQFKNK